MGVRGLEWFLENRCRDACYEVNIETIVAQYRLKMGKNPIIVIDAMCVLRHLYQGLSWINGGQMREFKERSEKFIHKFVSLGCELVIFMDGPFATVKMPLWKQRRVNSAQKISKSLQKCQYNDIDKIDKSDMLVLPNGLGSVFNHVAAASEHCQFRKCIRDCDEEIARYAYIHRCFAILSQDTDFVIFCAADYYLSAKNFNFDQMTTLCYDGRKLARALDLPDYQLPMLSSLLGNDIILFDMLQNFHNFLNKRFNNKWCSDRVKKVALFIKQNKCNIPEMAQRVFQSNNMSQLLQQSVDSYDLKKIASEDDVLNTSNSSDRNWANIEEEVVKTYIESPTSFSTYDVVVLGRFTSSTCLESYKDNSYRRCGEILKDIRRWIYGLLIKEKPSLEGSENYINELVMTGTESMNDFAKVYPIYLTKVEHPGLLCLWNSQEMSMDCCRWEILSEIFKISVTYLQKIPPNLLIPVLSLKYLKSQALDLEDWEYNAALSTCISVSHYSTMELSSLPAGPLLYKSIWFYTVLTRCHQMIFSILDIIKLRKLLLLPFEYTDGKLFHEYYRRAERGENPHSLCMRKVDLFEKFNLLKDILVS